MNDLISRQDLIDWLTSRIIMLKGIYGDLGGAVSGVREMVKVMPSSTFIGSERKKGKWIEISWSEPDPNVCCTSYAIQSAKCSICGKYHTTPYLNSLDYFPYCPNCGAEMRGE